MQWVRASILCSLVGIYQSDVSVVVVYEYDVIMLGVYECDVMLLYLLVSLGRHWMANW